MRNIHPKYISWIGEAMIPILGLLFWNWGLYFILLFYMIDMLVAEGFMRIKNRKIMQFQRHVNPLSARKWQGRSIGLFLMSLILIHFAVASAIPNIDFANEVLRFWTLKELGVQQGYLLLPLVVFSGYQNYLLFFLRFKKYETTTVLALWKRHVHAYYFVLGAALAVGLLGRIVLIPEWIYVLGIVAGIIGYKIRFDQD